MNASAARIEQGDLVFAREALYNDGCIPDLPDDALLAAPGTRGMVVTIGHAEAAPEEEIYLVRFEGEGGTLGPPVGCLREELTQDGAEAKRLAAISV